MGVSSKWLGVSDRVNEGLINEVVCASVCDAETPSMKGVIGLIGPGTTIDQNADYRAAFTDSALTNGMLDAAAQRIGFAVRSKEMTRLVWGVTQSFHFNLVLTFIAFENAALEVMRPIQLLNEMAAVPQGAMEEGAKGLGEKLRGLASDGVQGFAASVAGGASDFLLGGLSVSSPRHVQITIGKRIMYTDCVIESVSVPLDKERDKEGNLLRATVNLSIKSAAMLDQADITGMFR